jgi:hypothetical protein
MLKMLSERGKIFVIFENTLYLYIFFVNKWFVENLLYYLVFIIAFKHRWGPPLPTTCILLRGLQNQGCPGIKNHLGRLGAIVPST